MPKGSPFSTSSSLLDSFTAIIVRIILLLILFQTRLFWSALGRPCQVRVNKRVWYRKHLIPKHPFIFFILPRFCHDFAMILPRFCLTFKWVSKSLDKNIIPILMVTEFKNIIPKSVPNITNCHMSTSWLI